MTKHLRIGFLQATNEVDVQWFRPLAFGYLKAYLQAHLDFPIDMEFLATPEECVGFDVIGISSTSQAFTAAKEMAGLIRKTCKETIIILGGHHITYFPESLSEEFDLGVIGEGEETFLEFVRYFVDCDLKITSKHLRGIHGIAFRDNGIIVRTSQRDLISPLDSIPFPARSKESAYLFSSRGCPYKCAFCSSSAFWKETRFFSAEYVVREVEHLLDEFPDLTHIAIWDDLFVVNKPRFHSFVRLIEEKEINKRVAFSFSVRANLVDDTLCDALKKINVSATSFGAESGSNKILKVLNKGTSVEMNQKALDILHKHNIVSRCSFIVGAPTETEDDLRSTYEFILRNVLDGKLDPSSPVNILIPMPGTEMWNYAIETGKIDEKNIDWSRLSAYASYRNSTFTDFSSWVAYRRMKNTIYLAENTLPQERLYELMFIYEGVLKSLEKIGELQNGEKTRQVGINERGQRPRSLQKTPKHKGEHGSSPQLRIGPRGEYTSQPGFQGNRAICILGMHRSGTSAATRAINLLGPNIGRGEVLMPPVEGDNPHGFWEHMSLFSFHERLLSHLSSSWDSVWPLPEGWWMQPGIHPFREELGRLVESEFAGEGTWMWKDPRTSLLLPLWKDVLQEFKVDAGYLVCVRNPLDVAASLAKRNNFSKDKSLSLWLLYNLSALFWTDGEKRILLNYDDLLENWERSLRKISAFFCIPWPQEENRLRASMTEFIRPEERHSHASTELLLNDENAAEPVKRLYLLLLEALAEDDILNSERFRREITTIYSDYLSYAKVFTQPQMIHRGYAELSYERARAGLPESSENMAFPLFDSPHASIIIPAWNHWEYTSRCLRAILTNTHDVPYEVIIVDNGSSDKTKEMLAKFENVRVIRNPSNAGYVVACNQGAGIARGEYLVFLNNDTEPLAGWLKELVDTFLGDAAIGAVGGKLIYPDGLLQEAGSILFRDGYSWNFGNGDDPNEEIYNVMCEVDYCSGACLLVKNDLFAGVGGFDVRYSPAYYEDVDMCFSLRSIGYKVIYNPHALVIHYGSVTSLANKSDAWERHIEMNRKKFTEKWKNELTHQEETPSETHRVPVSACRERLSRKEISAEEILFLMHDTRSGRERNFPVAVTEKSILYSSFDNKIKKALDVIRRARRLYGNDSIGFAWTGCWDSTAVLHMIRQAFDGRIPFPVIRMVPDPEPPELRRFVEQLQKEWSLDLRVCDDQSSLHSPAPSGAQDGCLDSTGDMSIDRVFDSLKLGALITAQCRNKEGAPSLPLYFSQAESSRNVRIRPVLHFTKLDLLNYIKKYQVPFFEALTVPALGSLSEFKAAITLEEVPAALRASESFCPRVRIRNTSAIMWPSKGLQDGGFAVALSYHWIDGNGRIIKFDGLRTPLIHDVGPNEETVLYATVETPQLPADYTLEVDLVQEGVTWFKDKGSETAKAVIHVEGNGNH